MLQVQPAEVATSGITEGAISAATASSAAAAAPALLGVTPMSMDPDAIVFNELLRGAGEAYLGVALEHSGQRAAFGSAQGLSAGVYTAGEVSSAAALSL